MACPDDEDEDLRKAIALSLQEPGPPHLSESQVPSEIIDLTEDGPSVSKSLQHKHSETTNTEGTLSHSSKIPPRSDISKENNREPSPVPMTTAGFLGLDRKAMEEERLARLARKRKADSVSPPPLSRQPASKVSKTEASSSSNGVREPLSAREVTTSSHQVNLGRSTSNGESKAAADSRGNRSALPFTRVAAPNTSLQYPRGIVKKTWAYGHERKDHIKIEEVLQPADLNVAVLSAFQWDVEWVLSKINVPSTKLILVMQAKGEQGRDALSRDFANISSVRLCLPSMEGQINCMHSKLMLLFHTNHLRIVVPSANLVKYDWGETGVMENSVFLVDLPRFADGHQAAREDLTQFGKDLLYFLEAMDLQRDARDAILKFDFVNTSHLAFVHTIGGAHSGEAAKRTGLPGLSRAVRQLSLETHNAPEVDFCASSLGSLNDGFLQTLYSAVQGEDSHEGFLKSSGSKAKGKSSKASQDSSFAPFDRKAFRIYFPTHETVANSTGGTMNAGTICLLSKYYNNDAFPRDMMRDYKSRRPGMLSHNKILYVRSPGSDDGHASVAWAYVGSANLSESAWGKLVMDRSTKAPKLNCRNWECGVLIKVLGESMLGRKASKWMPSMDVFKGYVDVPFEFPGREYGGRKPWYFMG